MKTKLFTKDDYKLAPGTSVMVTKDGRRALPTMKRFFEMATTGLSAKMVICGIETV